MEYLHKTTQGSQGNRSVATLDDVKQIRSESSISGFGWDGSP
jgi:hypothetical protein